MGNRFAINPTTIRTPHFIVVITTTALLLALSALYTYRIAYSQTSRNAIVMAQTDVYNVSTRLDSFLQQCIACSDSLAVTIEKMLERQASPQEIANFLSAQNQLLSNRIFPETITLYGVFGDTYLNGDESFQTVSDYSPQERLWYRTAVAHDGKTAFIPPHRNPDSSGLLFGTCKLLGDRRSVLAIDIPADPIFRCLNAIQPTGLNEDFVMDDKGLVIAHTRANEIGINYLHGKHNSHPDDLNRLAAAVLAAPVVQLHANINGDDCLVFSQQGRFHWRTVVIANYSSFFSLVKAPLLQAMFVSLAVIALVCGFITICFNLMRRSQRLLEQSRAELQKERDNAVYEERAKNALNNCLTLLYAEDSRPQCLTVMRDICDFLGASRCFLLRYDFEHNIETLEFEYCSSEQIVSLPDTYQNHLDLTDPLHASLADCGVFLPDSESPEATDFWGVAPVYTKTLHIKSLYALKVVTNGALWGSLGITYDTQKHIMTDRELTFFRQSSGLLSLALERIYSPIRPAPAEPK